MTAHPLLAVVRGPSGSGKSTVARALRRELGRGSALVEQDHVRRTLLWEADTAGALNIDLVDTIARRTLAAGRSTVVEGIFPSARYGDMLRALLADHPGPSVCAYLDVPFEETVRRHATRPQAAEFTPDEMRAWWLTDDRLGVPGELVLGAESSAPRTTAGLLRELGVSAGAATPG